MLPMFIENRITPHVPNVIGNMNCPEIIENIRSVLPKGSKELSEFEFRVEKMDSLARHKMPLNSESVACKDGRHCDVSSLTMATITEDISPNKVTLSWYHETYSNNPEKLQYKKPEAPAPLDLLAIYWQVLYTLEVFNRMGLRHNNLNAQNILLSQQSSSRVSKYIVDGVAFYIPTTASVHITDYNLSTVNQTKGFNEEWEKVNTYIDDTDYIREHSERTESFCDAFGICNELNPKFDTFRFMCIINNLFTTMINKHESTSPKSFYAAMNRLVSRTMLNKSTMESSCYPPKEFKDQSKVSLTIPDGPTKKDSEEMWMKPTIKMMFDEVFNDFKEGSTYSDTFRKNHEQFRRDHTFTMPTYAPDLE